MTDTQIAITHEDDAEDTQPVQVVIPEDEFSGWRRVVGLFCLVGAAILTFGTALVLVLPAPRNSPEVGAEPVTVEPTPVPAVENIVTDNQGVQDPTEVLPTISPEQIQAILQSPVIPRSGENGFQITRNIYDPFTIIPERPRSEVIQYAVESGDTITSIAERFGLKPETIAWSNPRSYVQILRPGASVNVMPVDGVYHTAIGSSTIAEIAANYGVDSYTVIDSPYNNLFGTTPDTVLPSGTQLVIESGTAEQISWNPPVVRTGGNSGSSSASGNGQISFAAGDAGSCGLVENPGGGAAWARPISSYTWIRGFAAWHPAVDLAAQEGTPVYAANGGRVIFAGWSSWGYGYSVVLAHGPFTTLYAHLSGINVRCGQDVAPGQQIAASGNSGNSSGPHLHFEIRYQDAPQDPTYTIGF